MSPRARPPTPTARTMGRLLPIVYACLALVAVSLWPASAEAYPWMIRHGYGACRTCHTDPSGGETLNSFGRLQGDQLMQMRYSSDKSPSASRGFLWGAVDPPSQLQLGGSLRSMTIYTPDDSDVRAFPMQMDVYGHLRLGKVKAGGSIGLGRAPAGSPHQQAAQVTSNSGGLNMLSRNHWVGYEITPEVLLRGGRINLPFGHRLVEHVLWVRDRTRTDRESDQQHGVAFAYTGTELSAELMLIAGNYQISPDRFRERGYSATAEYLITPKLGIGLSSLFTTASADRFTLQDNTVNRHVHGLKGRWSPVKPLVLLLEGDVILQSAPEASDSSPNEPSRDLGYAGMLMADVELIQGLHLIGIGELLDAGFVDPGLLEPPDKAPGFGEPALGGWIGINWFFLPHLDLRIDAVFRQEEQTTLQAQLHAYL